MQPADAAPDPAHCPLCGGPNGCAMTAPQAGGGAPCWCAQARFPPALLARVPPAARRRACICPHCTAAAAAEEK